MDVTPLVRKGQQIIQSYSGGVFKISGVTHSNAVIVFPDGTEEWCVGDVSDVSGLTEDHFSIFLDKSNELDVVLLGTGKVIAFLPRPLRDALKANGLQVDVMDTGAACRTYNVLMAEGRRVACALLPS
ncbi:MAG: Mth938-like domain-containing protein [Alphaproteobacteria bacterium]